MIGSHEMSSTSMDISETFRPEDLSKTDFFDFVTAPDMGNGIGVGDRPPGSNDTNGQGDQALQGYDQFWSSDKDPNRLESTIFEDLDRYCWQQQTQSHHSTSSTNPSSAGSSISQPTSIVGGIGNTDGQIYTLTVLNGSEPWLKRDPDAPMAPTLDLDSLLGSFPGYIKSEYVYEESGGYNTGDGTKDDLSHQQHQTQNSGGLPVTTVVTTNSTNLAQFQNNNNDWHMADNNSTDQSSAESLLRSALQGKGYSKGLHLQNGIALIPTPNTVKDEELRRALFPTEQVKFESLSFADSTLSAPMFEDTQSMVNSPTSHHQQAQTSQPNSNAATTSSSSCTSSNNNTSHSTTAGIIVDDMFLSLETAFTDDFEKLKRIANEVQQFCTSSDYPEVIMEVTTGMPPQITQSLQVQPVPPPPPPPPPLQAPPPPQPLQPEVTTSNPISTSTITTKTTAKKYKRSSLNNNNSTNNNNNNSLPNNNNSNTSPTHCNGQRKERSLHYCAICSKGFKDKYSVNVHIRTHTGEKPFACSLCGKSFRQKAHLAKHYQTHLAQKSNGNVVKSGKQASSNRPQPQSTPTQRQVSPNTSGPSLPPANGLIANR